MSSDSIVVLIGPECTRRFAIIVEEGVTVTIAGTGPKAYRGKHGYPVTVDTAVDRISSMDFRRGDHTGRLCVRPIATFAAAVRLVREVFEQATVVAAICHAAWIPISAGDRERQTYDLLFFHQR